MKADRNKLELAMARSCMSTEELVIKAEMPLSTVKNVITGRSVRPVTLGKVARALGVDANGNRIRLLWRNAQKCTIKFG